MMKSTGKAKDAGREATKGHRTAGQNQAGQYRVVFIRRDTGEMILTDSWMTLDEFQEAQKMFKPSVLAPGHRLNPA